MKRTRIHLTLAAVGLFTLMTTAAATAAESLSVLLQKGIYAEETEGNLDAAIEIYEGIVKETETNRSLAAQAQYRLGMCHLKKGNKEEAASLFRKLVEQFPNEIELAAKTRVRLSELGQLGSNVVARKIWAGAEDTSWGARISPDGQYLTFINWSKGDLMLRDLKKGQNRRLTKNRSLEDGFGWSGTFSPDGKQIAYAWSIGKDAHEIRVLSVEKPEPRVVLTYAAGCYPADWSPDGGRVAVMLLSKGDGQQTTLALLTIADGTIRPLRHSAKGNPSNVRFSRDGKYLVYTRRATDQAEETDIYILNLADETEAPVIQHPAEDSVVAWAQNGRSLLFASDRRGSKDLWSIEIESGRAKGAPILIQGGLGEVTALGVTHGGALYYGVSSGGMGMYRAAIDFESGELLSPPRQIPRPPNGTVLRIGLSPDGRSLAYYVPQQKDPNWPKLMLLDLETGRHRRTSIAYSNRYLSPPVWSADSRMLFQRTPGEEGGRFVELQLIDTESGTATSLALDRGVPNPTWWTAAFDLENLAYVRWSAIKNGFVAVRRELKSGRELENTLLEKAEVGASFSFRVSHDLKHVFYSANPKKPTSQRPAAAFRYDFETGKQRQLMNWNDEIEVFPSPHGSMLAVSCKTKNNERTIKLLALAGEQVIEQWAVSVPDIAQVSNPPPASGIQWTPDSRYVLCQVHPRGNLSETELRRISAKTGEVQPTAFSAPSVTGSILVHPDAQQVFFIGDEPSVSEVWVMENFLPPVAAAK